MIILKVVRQKLEETMREFIVLGLFCIFAIASSSPTRTHNVVKTSSEHESTAGPEDGVNRMFLSWIYEQRGYIAGQLHKKLDIKWQDLAKTLKVPKAQDAECNGCTIFVDTVKLFIFLGLEYEDVEAVALEICEDLLAAEGYKGEIICPGVVPNYGPHIFTIFDTTRNTSTEVCEILDYCDSASARALKTQAETSKSAPEVPVPFNGLSPQQGEQMVRHAKARISKAKDARQKRQAVNVTFAHITDVHAEFDYVLGSATHCGLHMCCRNETNGTGSAGPWGSFSCNIPPATVELFLDYIAELQPDFLIYTGDTPSNALWAETNERQVNYTKWLAYEISQRLPGVPAFFTIGNHETFPTNLYYAPRTDMQILHQAFVDFWGPLGGFGSDQIDTINEGGYYSILVRPGLRILSWNSNYGTDANWYNILNHYRPEYLGMLDFVERTLRQARENGEKVIAMSHHPVGGGLSYYKQWETQLVVDYGDVILLHAQGHNHNDHFNVFVDPVSGEARSYQLSAPSMSTSPNKNPSSRIFHMDANTLELLNYEHYFLYLGNEEGLVEDPEIAVMYSAAEDYGMANMTAAGWLDFILRMNEDENLFTEYLLNRGTRYRTQTDCDDQCRVDELCDRINTVHGASRECPISL